ncbi:DUF4861 domain-containing protein [Arenibacter aquaticus]|uniref:DUF4861 domain-containing protein n=1 Tax=Arenibacter aquaticus TaxID=2489054 RepID=A0A430K489_9FLAO|nr:DUF4861 family protein [Arenibacter aquaticus]RTE53890.1 DUF4861 domain-containing protein [Arenibacter aquaticus]
MKKTNVLLFLSIPILLLSCEEGDKAVKQIIVKNTMAVDRANETVSIDLSSLDLNDKTQLVIRDAETKENLVSQQIDSNDDGKLDAILFQPKIAANSERTFQISSTQSPQLTDSIPNCYSRFVPERTDDYAWENNRVAFRTYGPTAQKMVEEDIKGGTLSSGIDAWLKRVDYPIINKWYKKELETDGSYHKDTGEGLDNFHVGSSRGVGGIAKKVDTTYYFSKNFTSWKTLCTGPIRTSFVLTYANWDAAGNTISEEKRISLDYGSNLSKFVITARGTDTLSAGLTLHEKDGDIAVNEQMGWISYWEPHEDSELGTAIVVPENAMVGHEHYLTDQKDESNLFAHIKKKDNKITYYAGFGWKKSGQFATKAAWEKYVNDFAQRIKNPLLVEIKQ